MSSIQAFVVLSEVAQIDLALTTFKECGEILFFAIDKEVEYALEKRGQPYVSAKEFRDQAPQERTKVIEAYVRELAESEVLSFFAYRDIPLALVNTFVLREYINQVLYFAAILERAGSRYAHWVIYSSLSAPPISGGPLAPLMHDALLAAAHCAARGTGVALEIVGRQGKHASRRPVPGLRFLRSIALVAYNALIAALQSPRPTQLVVSDHWRNIDMLAAELPHAEFRMLERSELFAIPWGALWRHRIRFGYRAAPSHHHIAAQESLKRAWWERRRAVPILRYGTLDATEVVVTALDHLIQHALDRQLKQVDEAYQVLLPRPRALLLRTSVGGQTQYPILALAAKRLGIPAVEVQHGLEYLGAGSMSLDHRAERIAVYGPLIRQEFERAGYASDRILEIGSPRFDRYAKHEGMGSAVLCISPDIYTPAGMDTYDVADYFSDFFAALPHGAHALIKLRGPLRSVFFAETVRRAARGASYEMVGGTLPDALARARLVVSSYSTSVLEGLLQGLPVVLWTGTPLERRSSGFHFARYESAGALRIAHDAQALQRAVATSEQSGERALQVVAAREFLRANFLFDGQAAVRLARYLEGLAMVR